MCLWPTFTSLRRYSGNSVHHNCFFKIFFLCKISKQKQAKLTFFFASNQKILLSFCLFSLWIKKRTVYLVLMFIHLQALFFYSFLLPSSFVFSPIFFLFFSSPSVPLLISITSIIFYCHYFLLLKTVGLFSENKNCVAHHSADSFLLSKTFLKLLVLFQIYT